MIIFGVAVHTPAQLPPCPSQQRTISMVHEIMETQKIDGQGIGNRVSKDDYDTPIINFINVKKHKSKKN
jgi:hypothetical protein